MNPDFLTRAIELSREGMRANEGGPFGAVVVRGGEIIAEGTNQVLATNDPTNHAEMVAIRRATGSLGRFDLSDCELYANCEPCPMCLGAIYWARLGKVWFANTRDDAADIDFDDSLIYRELGKPIGDRRIPFEHVPDERALEVFGEWLDKEDRTAF
jgi:guanine deaminase